MTAMGSEYFRHGRDAAYVLKVPFGINYEVRNKERMPETGPYIIIANHQSAFDVPCKILFLYFFGEKKTLLACFLISTVFHGLTFLTTDLF